MVEKPTSDIDSKRCESPVDGADTLVGVGGADGADESVPEGGSGANSSAMASEKDRQSADGGGLCTRRGFIVKCTEENR